MDVVGHASYAVGLAMKVLGDAIEVGVEFLFMILWDGHLAAIGAEDDVVVGGSVAHDVLCVL